MPKVRARVSSKGQITLPKAIRECLGLQQGSTVEMEVEDGAVTIRPVVGGFLRFGGCVSPKHQPEDWKSIQDHVAREVARRAVEKDS